MGEGGKECYPKHVGGEKIKVQRHKTNKNYATTNIGLTEIPNIFRKTLRNSNVQKNHTFKLTIEILIVFVATPAVFKVETWQIFQDLVQRLLLVFVALAKPQRLVGAEFADLVALENVILPNPV